MTGFPFVIRDIFEALPHPTSIRAGVVGFHLSPVLTLCLFDGLSEGIARYLIRVRVSSSFEAAALAFSHGFWFGYVRTVTVGTTSSMHILIKPVTDVVNSSMPSDESRNIFQSVLVKQSCSLASV